MISSNWASLLSIVVVAVYDDSAFCWKIYIFTGHIIKVLRVLLKQLDYNIIYVKMFSF